MTISEFATKHRLKTRRDMDVPGTHDQSHIYEVGEAQLGV